MQPQNLFRNHLDISPFELVFGNSVRGPLKLVKEKILDDEPEDNILDYVSTIKERLYKVLEVARENLKNSQSRMKNWYDKRAKERSFKPEDQVLVPLPIPKQPLQARYFGPYQVEQKISDVNYIIQTPGRRKKKRVCHINMMREYHEREGKPIAVIEANGGDKESDEEEIKPQMKLILILV